MASGRIDRLDPMNTTDAPVDVARRVWGREQVVAHDVVIVASATDLGASGTMGGRYDSLRLVSQPSPTALRLPVGRLNRGMTTRSADVIGTLIEVRLC